MSLATLPKTVRTFSRLRVIAQVLSKHGFGHFVDRLQLARYLPSVEWLRRGKPKEEPEVDPLTVVGNRLVRVCEELGPTFVKLGQMASTRPDILPPQILSAMERLQDDVTPFPPEQARRIFLNDTGSTVGEAFREFTDQPFASGSIGQVHRAVAADGQKVVVKIKRPGIDHVVQLDIYVLQWMAERAESLFPELRPYHPKMLVDEFAQTIRTELDFINEASATSRFHEAFRDDPNISTPRVRWDLTGPSALTLEFMEGLRFRGALEEDSRRAAAHRRGGLNEAPAQESEDSSEQGRDNATGTPHPTTPTAQDRESPHPPLDRKALAINLSECFLRQFFELGLFHADPHPGNLLIRPPAGIVLFDFGMVGKIDDELIGQLVIGIVAAVRREVDILIDVLADVGALGRETDRQMLARDLRGLLDKYYGLPLRRMDLGTIFRELLETVRRNDVTLPRNFVAMFKSLATVSGVVLQLDPDLNLVSLLQPKLSGLLRDRLSPRRLLRFAGMSAWHVASILRDAPRFIRDLMRGIGRGQFQINIRHENLDYLASELDRSSNRIAFSVVAASTVVGSSMLLSMETDVTVLGMPIRYLGFAGYGLAFFMAAWLLVAILRSGKMS
ncbi:MAG: AarF/ABC1/UbiB kinase family protein [Phycisphaerae bacterium]|nr:AarF/ABC1/UbiB kinase family protein [Phycisphaerae bacterium]